MLMHGRSVWRKLFKFTKLQLACCKFGETGPRIKFFLPEPSATVPTPWSQNGGQNMISFSPNSRSSLQTLYNCFHMLSCAPDDEQTDLHMKYQWSASLKEKGGGGVKGGQTGKETRTGILLECPCAQLKGFKCYHSDDAGHVN